jgi:hypothetical protein
LITLYLTPVIYTYLAALSPSHSAQPVSVMETTAVAK